MKRGGGIQVGEGRGGARGGARGGKGRGGGGEGIDLEGWRGEAGSNTICTGN
mgnify:CR=1 FL=1